MTFNRASGILLHPTSLPGPDGIGDLGPEAYRFVDFIADSGCTYWQILPLNPTGYGDSPYQCFSAFAGNPYLISPVLLLDEGLLNVNDLADRPLFPDERVDFGPVIEWKKKILHRAYLHFTKRKRQKLLQEYQLFQQEHATWLPDYALFMALKDKHDGHSWAEWPENYRKRESDAISKFSQTHQDVINEVIFGQFLFFRQWKNLKNYANKLNLKIIGDIPIFIAHDSADAWMSPHLFTPNPDGSASFIAGVPPDGFSATGQLWGNPHYRWEVHKQNGYSWWVDRIQYCLKVVDILRLDHFIGFTRYFEIPGGMPTAEIGEWKPGPGADLFNAIKDKLGSLPIIAEDLGVVIPEVISLREKFDMLGMRIFQFAFYADDTHDFLPHNYQRNTVAYTGVHDNDTTTGWFISASDQVKGFCLDYLGTSGENIAWDMIRGIWRSIANLSLAPMQDFLCLGTDARMNYPGRQAGNWSWRMPVNYQDHHLVDRIYRLNEIFSRKNKANEG